MTPELRALLTSERPPDPDAVERYVSERGSPVVDGTSVTFLHRGEADAVYLQHFIYGLPTAQPLHHVPGTDVWWIEIELPRASRIEYKFVVERGRRKRLIRDRLNQNLAFDPFGANSVCHGDGYVTPHWTLPDPEARPGTIETHEIASEAYGGTRSVRVYLPARMRPTRRYALLVVLDGDDYMTYARLQTVLDNLLHQNEVTQLVVACTQSPDRMREYAANEATARFLADELVPYLESVYPLRRTAASRGLLGASLGAVTALHAAWRRPGTFGRLLLQSGSFAFTDIGREVRSPVLEPVVDFVNPFRENPGKPSERVFVSCGVYERLIYENRSLVPLLQRTGMDVRFVESRDGHNWENWRDRLREGLAWLFPGPLGLVYE